MKAAWKEKDFKHFLGVEEMGRLIMRLFENVSSEP